jgi:hypothetical protein
VLGETDRMFSSHSSYIALTKVFGHFPNHLTRPIVRALINVEAQASAFHRRMQLGTKISTAVPPEIRTDTRQTAVLATV